MAEHTVYRFRGFQRPHYTQVPDELFDELMPHLNESELKVLLYIIRRTFGFKKDSDHISLSQMAEGITTKDGRQLDGGTGLARRSVMRGLKGLLEKGVVVTVRQRTSQGDYETNLYALSMRDEQKWWGQFDSTGGDNLTLPVGTEVAIQETVLQQTVEQETVHSNIRMAPPSTENGIEYDEDRQLILEYVEDLAREFRDKASLKSSTTRATNLYRQSGLSLDDFLERLQQARAITKERSASIRSQGAEKGNKHKMAYFFACLENTLEPREERP